MWEWQKNITWNGVTIESTENSEKSESQMVFKPTTLRNLVGCSTRWAAGDSRASTGSMWIVDSSCITQQQNHSLLSVERYVTSRKTAAKETNRVTVCRGFESHLVLAFFRVSSGFYRNTISCNKYEERQKRLTSIFSLNFFSLLIYQGWYRLSWGKGTSWREGIVWVALITVVSGFDA